MTFTFKEELQGPRLTLKKTFPDVELAKIVFSTIEKNREHLNPWFPWVKPTQRVEDTIKYLLDKEEETKQGKKAEYGLYIDNNYLGNISVFDISETNKCGEIGYWITKDAAGNGYMTEAVKIIEKEFFENHQLNRLYINCDEKNIPSARVAEKCGFIKEACLRDHTYSEQFEEFRNTLTFGKLKKEFEKEAH